MVVLGLSSFDGEKYLKIPKEAIKQVVLELKDPLSGTVTENYELDAGQVSVFIDEINKSKEAPTLKMNVTCYQLRISYLDGREIILPTNGKGIGPTEVGYFKADENFIFKYFPIDRQKFCKPQTGDAKSGGFGF